MGLSNWVYTSTRTIGVNVHEARPAWETTSRVIRLLTSSYQVHLPESGLRT